MEPIEKLLTSIVKTDKEIISLIYKDLAQPSVQKVGKALSTVFGLGNTLLLPIKLLNEKANHLFVHHMEKFRRNLDQIDENKIQPIEPQIGVPILESLEYTTNQKLGNLYINLLTTASNFDTASHAHPSYVKIIGNITPDEAFILEFLDEDETSTRRIPFISLKLHFDFGSSKKDTTNKVSAEEHITEFEYSSKIKFPKLVKLYISNLIGLGLIQSEIDNYVGPDFDELKKKMKSIIDYYEQDSRITIEYIHGYFSLTDFGKGFIRSCKMSASGSKDA